MSENTYTIRQTKKLNDPIHGFFILNADLFKFIDTKIFQRLRELKQLGGMYHIFYGACHNRFEHSIGTAYLAEKWMRHFKKFDDSITERDIYIVQVAALCHDLGHGPFSHTFQDVFVEKLGISFEHEDASCILFEKINEELSRRYPKDPCVLSSDEVEKVKAMIKGDVRDPSSTFMYRIVSNKRDSIDVDKFDYIVRDCKYTGLPEEFQYDRIIAFSRLKKCGDFEKDICYDMREGLNLFKLYFTRYCLFKKIYTHNVVKAVELMIGDILWNADDVFGISKCMNLQNHWEKYVTLTDNILYSIETKDANDIADVDARMKLKKAQKIYSDLKERKLYKFVCVSSFKDEINKEKIMLTKMECLNHLREKFGDKVIVCIVKVDFSMKAQNPMTRIYFYDKEDEEAKKITENNITELTPKRFQEVFLRVYSRDRCSRLMQEIYEEFVRWSKEKRFLRRPIPSTKLADVHNGQKRNIKNENIVHVPKKRYKSCVQ